MDIKESHRVLELEIGAPRDAVEAAYLRLLERWHPDRVTPSGDPAAMTEATRMVQFVNEAYQTLIKIAPPPATQSTEPDLPRKKPALPPLTPTVFSTNHLPPPRPSSAPLPPPPSSPPAFPPPPAIGNGAAPLSSTQGAASPLPDQSPPPPAGTPATVPSPSSGVKASAMAIHDALFPAGSSLRRFSPVILTVAVLLVLLLAKCTFSSAGQKSTHASDLDPTKTGRVLVKSNRPDTEVELARVPDAREAASTVFHGSGAEFTLRGMPPGKYVLTAKSERWPEIRQEVSVGIARSSEVAVHFKSGSLRVDSDPAGATVKLAGAVLGKTPLIIPQLPPGECQLSLEYPTWPIVSVKTTITENVESTETVRLPHGKLIVETVPTGATVVLGGRAVGRTPLTLERVPAGIQKLTLQSKDFPKLEVSVTVDDRGEMKLHRELASGFPELDPPALLRAVWMPDDPNQLSPGVDSLGRYEPRNGIVRNLHRKRLYENWLNRRYRFASTIKSYDRDSGKIEFTEQANALSKYRIVAELSPAARNDTELAAQLIKGATVTLYGPLDAVEEPRWPFKVITFEISSAEPLH